jgi:hypothetical protein
VRHRARILDQIGACEDSMYVLLQRQHA